jgi:hypothetical protein
MLCVLYALGDCQRRRLESTMLSKTTDLPGYSKGQQITGIIKTMPMKFFKEYGLRRFMNDYYYYPNISSDHCWSFALSGRPKFDILYLYLLVNGRIRFRSNIIQFEGPGQKVLWINARGRKIVGKAWVLIGGPVVKAPRIISMTGFQGFRYTGDLW